MSATESTTTNYIVTVDSDNNGSGSFDIVTDGNDAAVVFRISNDRVLHIEEEIDREGRIHFRSSASNVVEFFQSSTKRAYITGGGTGRFDSGGVNLQIPMGTFGSTVGTLRLTYSAPTFKINAYCGSWLGATLA